MEQDHHHTTTFELPAVLRLGTLGLCALPLILFGLGVSLSSHPQTIDLALLKHLSPDGQLYQLNRSLSGKLVQPLLESIAATTAFLTGLLSLILFRVSKNPILPLLAVFLMGAGAMDAFHTLAANSLIADSIILAEFLPFSWAVFRILTAFFFCLGAGLLLRRGTHLAQDSTFYFALACIVSICLLGYATVHLSATAPQLPQTIFPDQWISRPFDLIPVPFFLLLGFWFLPRLHQKGPSHFTLALLWSIIPQLSVQFYMAFGSQSLYDHWFNAAYSLKILAYLLPFLGLMLDYLGNIKARDEAVVHSNRLVNELLDVQNELQFQRSQIASILDTAADGIITINHRGIIQSFNKAAEKIFGYSSEEVLNQNVSILQPQEVRAHHDDYIQKYIETGLAHIIGIGREVEGRHKDGHPVPLYLSVSEIQGQGERLFTGILHDISERKEAKAKLEESLLRFEQLTGSINDIFWMTNADGSEIIYVSPAYEKIWGRSCESLYQNPTEWQQAIHPDDLPRVQQMFTPEKLAAGQYNVEYRVLRPDGETRWIHAIGYPTRDHDGDLYRISGIAADITAFKEVERIKSMFIASMSHELRTPLNSIIGFTSITCEEWTGPLNEEQRANLQTVLRSGKHLLNLINDVIDVSKIEARKLEIHLENVDVDRIVREAVDTLRAQADEKALKLVVEAPKSSLKTDPGRLLQCLLNLVSNAVKYTESGEVSVTLETGLDSHLNKFKSGVKVRVKDSGIGIEPADIKRLFTPFTRLDSPLKATVSGTGLGLYLTAKLSREILQGDIQCSSQPGEGSCFTLWIPDLSEMDEA